MREQDRAGLKRELGNVGHDMADFLGVHAWARSVAVAKRTELTGVGPRCSNSGARRGGGTMLMGQAHDAEKGGAGAVGEVGTDRWDPLRIERARARTRAG